MKLHPLDFSDRRGVCSGVSIWKGNKILPQYEWSVKVPQTTRKNGRVYTPKQNTICEDLNVFQIWRFVCGEKIANWKLAE